MVSFETIEEAKKFGDKISAERLKSVCIYRNFRTNKFDIFLTEETFNKFYKGCSSHVHAYLCHNFETPFAIGYKLFKNKINKSVVEQFASEEEMKKTIKKKKEVGYSVSVLYNEKQISNFLGIV